MITVAELIAELERHEGNRVVYVGMDGQIAPALTVRDAVLDEGAVSSVLIEGDTG